MTTEKTENTSLVASLISQFEAQIAALQTAVVSLRAVQATGALGSVSGNDALGTAVSAANLAAIDLPEGAFKNKSIPQCIELYLSTVGMKKKTNQEITDALKEGGVESTGELGNSVSGALFKLRKLGKILRFKEGWGLASNYPAHIRGAADTGSDKSTKPKAKKPRAKAKAKSKAKAVPKSKAASQPVLVVEKKRGETAERIVQILRSKPDAEFTPQQVAKDVSLNVKIAHMVLAKLAKSGKADKTASGNYRAITAKPQATHHAVM